MHQNHITGSRVAANLLNGWILRIGGVASGAVFACDLRSRLVVKQVCLCLGILISSLLLLKSTENSLERLG